MKQDLPIDRGVLLELIDKMTLDDIAQAWTFIMECIKFRTVEDVAKSNGGKLPAFASPLLKASQVLGGIVSIEFMKEGVSTERMSFSNFFLFELVPPTTKEQALEWLRAQAADSDFANKMINRTLYGTDKTPNGEYRNGHLPDTVLGKDVSKDSPLGALLEKLGLRGIEG